MTLRDFLMALEDMPDLDAEIYVYDGTFYVPLDEKPGEGDGKVYIG